MTPEARARQLRAWIVTALGDACGLTPAQVDPRRRFGQHGLDSLRAIRMIAGLAETLGRPLSPTLVWEYPTAEALADHLAGVPVSIADLANAGAADAPIAIVGVACRMPGAPDIDAFWRLLRDGVDAVGEVPADRGWDAFLAARGVTARERRAVRRGGFLARVDEFDPLFFGISPREAAAMDPQQRLMLELTWEAIEDAGVAAGSLAGTATGVFTGAIWAEQAAQLYDGGAGGLDQFSVTGSHFSIIANRVSYAFGLRGPSLTLDAACSSGLVVVHLACESLRRGESTLALAGAVNLNTRPDSALAVARFGALAPDGVCRTFDARADGYVRGEGGGVVVLKPLARALADGDPIRAVIRGSAINNDGASNGLTAPSRAAQEEVLAAACRRAGVRPRAVQVVEAHGTGTPLGDPIEARALSAVYGAGRPAEAPLLVGSAKTNVGHLEGAAGMVGLLKAVLAIQHRVVPPSLHYTRDNPHAPMAELGLAVPTTARAWPEPERALLAGVSSFGLGGTNGHVIVEEWPGPVPAMSVGPEPVGVAAGGAGPVFVFPGQGAQWIGMARELMHTEPVIRATLVACDREIRRWADWSLLAELAGVGTSRLGEIEVSLPAIIAVDVAVAAWWRSQGIEPAAVVGHSTGEIAAAHVAGILDLADTMRTICAYGRLVGRFAGRGGMAFVGLAWDACAAALAGFEGRVFPAIEDSVEGTVVAGQPDALTELGRALAGRGVFFRPVRMDVGPHSPLVASVRDELFAALRDIRPRPATVPLISEVTGAEVDGRTLDAAHWVRNFGDPARFSSAIEALIDRGHRVFLEVGPHPITQHSLAANLRRVGGGVVVASMRRDEDGRATLREASGTLASAGVVGRGEGGEDDDGAAWLLPVSARSEAAMAARAGELATRLGDAELRVRDVVYTACARREGLEQRMVVVGRSREALAAGLAAFAGGATEAAIVGAVQRTADRRVLVFAGQGSQWIGMGRRLMAESAVFRAALAECDELVRAAAGWSLIDELAAPAETSRLHAPEVAQPALFAVQVGLAAVLASWGITPDAVMGQSAGEVAAAHVAGALTLADAVRVIVLRGRVLRAAIGRGTMAWVQIGREAAARVITGVDDVAIAAVNDPASLLLSGGPGLAAVLAELTARGVLHRPLKHVEYASHGPQMAPLANELVRALGAVAASPASVPIYSTVTGGPIAGEQLGAAYWGQNLRSTVELAQATARAHADGSRLFIEVGPHPVVTPSVAACLEAAGGAGRAIATLRREGDEVADMLAVAGEVWVRGGSVELARLHPGGRVVGLPGYPWQRARHRIVARAARRSSGEHPLLGAPFVSALHPEERAWTQTALAEAAPGAAEHGLGGAAVVPGGLFVAQALAAGEALFGRCTVVGLRFERILATPCEAVQVAVAPGTDGAVVTIASMSTDGWTRHASAVVRRLEDGDVLGDRSAAGGDVLGDRSAAGGDVLGGRSGEVVANDGGAVIAEIMGRCGAAVAGDEHYARFERFGVTYGGGLRSVERVWIGAGEAIGRVRGADEGDASVLLDGCLQVAMALVLARADAPAIPTTLATVWLDPAAPAGVWAHARARGEEVDVEILDDAGREVGRLSGLRCAQMAGAVDPLDDCAYEVVWRRRVLVAGSAEPGQWIVIGEGDGTGATLAAALRRRGAACRLISGPELLAGALGEGCRGVVLCGGLASAAWPATTAATLLADVGRAALGVVVATQAIVGASLRDPPRLVLVTRGVQAPSGPVAVAQAPVWGVGRTLALEHPELECLRIDLAATRWPGEPDAVVDELLAGDEESEVALRDDGRFVARMVSTRLPAVSSSFVADGSYLISGGLGGLGLALARWLAERGAGHLVLVARRAPDARQAVAIAEIAATGAHVHVMQADVADAEQVARVIAEVQARLPALRGVVHAAAVIEDRTLARLTEPEFWAPVRPKLLGAWNLHAATRGIALDFFALYSSLGALLGSPGQAAYSAGNAFLDALARARVAEGLPATSVQWGPHAEVGMTTALGDGGARLAAHGMAHFTPADGCALFGRAIAGAPAVVGVVRFSLRQWLESTPQMTGSRFLSELPAEVEVGPAQVGVRAALAEAPAAERRGLLAAHVVGELGRVLRLAPTAIGRATEFSRLGLDSLMGLETRNRLERSLGLRLAPTLCFTYPDADSLTEFLAGQLGLDAAEAEDEQDDDELLAEFDASMRALAAGGVE